MSTYKNTEELNILLEKFKNGDQQAFNEIYRSCYWHVTFVCSKLCANKEDIEEIVQDTFIAVFKKAKTLNGDTFLALLRKIAARRCYDKYKNAKNEYENIVYEYDTEHQELDDAFLPEEYLQNKEAHAELMQIINELPAKQREMIYLYYYTDINTEEIAKLHKCTSVNVRAILHKARKSIKSKLESKSEAYAQRMVGVSIGAALLMEEQAFVATAAELGLAVASLDIAAKAAAYAAAGNAGIVAACVVSLGVVSAALYITHTPPDAQYQPPVEPTAAISVMVQEPLPDETLEEVLLPAEEEYTEPAEEQTEEADNHVDEARDYHDHGHEPVYEPTPPTVIEQEPIDIHPEEQAEQEPLPPLEEPYEPQELEEPEYIYAPAEADEPYEPAPIPIDRTDEILAALAAATTEQGVARIISYYGFAVETQMRSSMGEWLRFYTADEGSGEILIGISTDEDGSNWRMQFRHYNNGHRPLYRAYLFHWMDD